MRTTIMPDSKCPECRAALTAASNIDGDQSPRPGDLSICGYCGAALMFDDQLQAAPLPLAVIARLPACERDTLHTAQAVIRRRRIEALRVS